jgi:hypothetical protein
MNERAYIVYPAVLAPSASTIVSVIGGCVVSWWLLVALPFIWLGAACSAPNLNLVNGCLAYLAIIVGVVVFPFFSLLGFAITAGTASGYYLSAIEKWIRTHPAPDA